ncbi:hypothetical protein FACS189496_2820 [Bacilli bacterium]|nr:hypothetical protein FACS189496_2820 [Bacilli bacterium]
MSNINGAPGTSGRGNICPVTINIVRLASQAKNDVNKFFELFENIIEECRKQLMHRYDVLKHLKVSDLPFSAGQHLLQGAEDLSYNDSIEPILKQGS